MALPFRNGGKNDATPSPLDLLLKLAVVAHEFAKSPVAAQLAQTLADANTTRVTAAPVVVADSPNVVVKWTLRGLRTAAYVTAAFVVGTIAGSNATLQQFAKDKYGTVREAAPAPIRDRLPDPSRETVGADA